MDTGHEFDARDELLLEEEIDDAPPPVIGSDERRMHVRAYNYWTSLLAGRAYPSIEDLDPASIEDFGPNSVLLDFTAGVDNPTIAWLGRALREESGVDATVKTTDEVPARSLLSRLTDHYLQIIANRAPVGFEAEFVNHAGVQTFYRGILMPFSSDDDTIDFVYGVINWKHAAADAVTEALSREINDALRAAPATSVQNAPLWADGPQANFDAIGTDAVDDAEEDPGEDAGLWDWLAAARASAAHVRDCEGRAHAALYRAIGRAYDFALSAEAAPADFEDLLADEGLKIQARAPMTPIVKLVFGIDYDKTRLTEYAAALSHAKRLGLARGAVPAWIESHAGGLKAIVAAERAFRQPVRKPDSIETARAALRGRPSRAIVEIETGQDEFVLLVGRRIADGQVAILEAVTDAAMTDKAVRKAVN